MVAALIHSLGPEVSIEANCLDDFGSLGSQVQMRVGCAIHSGLSAIPNKLTESGKDVYQHCPVCGADVGPQRGQSAGTTIEALRELEPICGRVKKMERVGSRKIIRREHRVRRGQI